jgi:antitoxin component YwqK of YwqJK toxin-antitoxin module
LNIKNGLLDGIQKRYFKSGNLSSIAFFKKDKPSGLSLDFYESGKIASEWIYENGTSAEAIYYESGELKLKVIYIDEYNISNFEGFSKKGNKLDGKIICKYNSGKIDFIGYFINGKPDKYFKSYFESGNLAYEGFFIQGKANGVHKTFSENGKLIIKTPFKDGKVDGTMVVLNEFIDITKEINFKNGKMIVKK